jgi:hypothetical protein
MSRRAKCADLIAFVRSHYGTNGEIPLHAPVFGVREREDALEAIDWTFVSSVGAFGTRLEGDIASYLDAPAAVATVNGTAALHIALLVAGVTAGGLVVTQPFTFVSTCNALAYCGAEPVFVDVDRGRLSLSAQALEVWLEENCRLEEGGVCRTSLEGRVIRACVPMHTFLAKAARACHRHCRERGGGARRPRPARASRTGGRRRHPAAADFAVPHGRDNPAGRGTFSSSGRRASSG